MELNINNSFDAPCTDLLTYTFGNELVPDSQPILLDADYLMQGTTKEETKDTASGHEWCCCLTKGELHTLVRRLVAGFRRLSGGRRGFTVALHSFNHIVYPALFLAIIGAGGRWTGSNPAYTAGELAHHLRKSKAEIIITSLDCLEVASAAAEENNISPNNIFVLNTSAQIVPPTLKRWTELLQYGESDWDRFDDEKTAKETISALFTTSGTTGLPKMAARSHYSLVAENFAIHDKQPHQSKRLATLPFFHAFGSALILIDALRNGCPTYIMRRFQQRQFLDAIERFSITETAMVPPLLLGMLSYSAEDQAKLRRLQVVYCAGSPLDPNVQAQAGRLFAPAARIVQVWGMTECGWISTFKSPENDNTGSVGRLLSGFEAKIIDTDGQTMINGMQSGELCVRSPMLMIGYLDDEKATRETIDEQGWLRTGDIGTIRKGKIYIVDRKKELIKVNGWQIAPAELEGILHQHACIEDAAVIGVRRPGQSISAGEIPRAYITLVSSPGATTISEEDIRKFMLEHLARYKVGACEIRFRSSIPRSASGKILRKVLREEANMENELRRDSGVAESELIPVPTPSSSPLPTVRRAARFLTEKDLPISPLYDAEAYAYHDFIPLPRTRSSSRELFWVILRWLIIALGIGLGAFLGFGGVEFDTRAVATRLRHIVDRSSLESS